MCFKISYSSSSNKSIVIKALKGDFKRIVKTENSIYFNGAGYCIIKTLFLYYYETNYDRKIVMRLILLCFVLFLSGCSSAEKEKVDFKIPVPEFKIRRSKTVRHPLPKFNDAKDNGKLYILKRK